MLLEGPDIRALLAQVRDEHGPDARIVHAERVRTGGVGGFFAKQRFEVTVEVDVPADARTSGATPEDAGREPEREEQPARRTGGLVDPAQPVSPVSWTGPLTAVAPTAPAAPAAPVGEPVDRLLAAVDEAEQQVRRTVLTPVGPSAVSTHLTAAAAADEATPLGDLVARLQAPVDEAPATVMEAPARGSIDPVLLAAIAARAGQAATAATMPAQPTTPPAPAPSGTPIADAILGSTTAVPSVAEVASVAPVRSLRPVGAPVPRAPRRPGEVLVLVGEAGPAYDAARTLASSLRIPADRLRVVSPDAVVPGLPDSSRVSDLLEARLAGAQLAMERTPGIVVVDAPLSLVADPHGCAWVADVLAALEPTAVWAVVDATRRTQDLRRWLEGLPEVEALAVHGAAVTSDPEAVRDLDVPVALVDGRPVPDAEPVAPEALVRRRTS